MVGSIGFPIDKNLFEIELLEALRSGMINAMKGFDGLSDVNVTGTERTLYSLIRDGTLLNLESKGYDYLTEKTNFFPIGEVSTGITNKKADGFICDPSLNKPRYAIEIKIGSPQSYFLDVKKMLSVWQNDLDLFGGFVLLFEKVKKEEESICWLDGSKIISPFRDDFSIYSLIIPINEKSMSSSYQSKTMFEYFKKHFGAKTYSLLCFSGQSLSDTGNQIISPIIKAARSNKRIIITNKCSAIKEKEADEILHFSNKYSPKFIIFDHSNPLTAEWEKSVQKQTINEINEKILKLVKNGSLLLITGEWGTINKEWNKGDIFGELMPIEILHNNKNEGEWNRWNNPAYFGKDIVSKDKENLDLSDLDINEGYCIKGFVKTRIKEDENIKQNLIYKEGSTEYPIIVSRKWKKGKIVWMSFSPTGGWPGGNNGFKNWEEGKKIFWDKLFRFGIS